MATVTAYLDANVLVALVSVDALTARAEQFLRRWRPALVVSDLAAAEFASAISRRVRAREMTADSAWHALSTFDAWTARAASRVDLAPCDIATASAYLRRLDLPLRTPDAIHIAMAQRLDCELLTFDAQMSASARALGTRVAAV